MNPTNLSSITKNTFRWDNIIKKKGDFAYKAHISVIKADRVNIIDNNFIN
jgi:hypothetical protein